MARPTARVESTRESMMARRLAAVKRQLTLRPARLITTSAPSSSACHAPGDAASQSTARPGPSARGFRLRTTTSCPSRRKARASVPPRKPRPPGMTIFMAGRLGPRQASVGAGKTAEADGRFDLRRLFFLRNFLQRRKPFGGESQLLLALVKRIGGIVQLLEEQADGGRFAAFHDLFAAEIDLAHRINFVFHRQLRVERADQLRECIVDADDLLTLDHNGREQDILSPNQG